MNRANFLLFARFVLALLLALSALACNEDLTGDADGDDGGFCVDNSQCNPGEVCYGNQCLVDGTIPGDIDGDWENGVDGDFDIPDGGNGEIPADHYCPTATIGPNPVDFGYVPFGSDPVLRQFAVKNDSGNGMDLNVWDIHYDNINQTTEFTWEFANGEVEFPVVLAPGESLVLNVHYLPINPGADEAVIEVSTDDCTNKIQYITLKAPEKGSRYVCVNEVLDSSTETNVSVLGWPMIQFGLTGEPKLIEICNCGDQEGNKVLELTEIRKRDGNDFAFNIVSGQISPFDPIRLVPGACHFAQLEFAPSPPDDWDPTHGAVQFSNYLQIFNNSDEVTERIKEVLLQGTAEGGAITTIPFPIEYNVLDWGDQVTKSVHFMNWAYQTLTLDRIELIAKNEGDDCSPFQVVTEDLAALLGLQIPAMSPSPADTPLRIVFAPQETEDGLPKRYNCSLRVQVPELDNNFFYFPIKGRAKPPNEPPECRMSTMPHGAPVITDLVGLEQFHRYCFYGEISTDVDSNHQMVEFQWFFNSTPDGSEAMLTPIHIDWWNVCTEFDRPGEYEICLKVRDNEDAWCNPECVIAHVNGEQGLSARVDFEMDTDFIFLSESHVDLDLGIADPYVGYICSDDRINSANNCTFPDGGHGNAGTMTMSRWHSPTDGVRSAYEEFRMLSPIDGAWSVIVELADDCDDWVDILVIPFCASRTDVPYSLKLKDPNDFGTELFPDIPKTGTLTEAGDYDEYIIERRNGVWTNFYQAN